MFVQMHAGVPSDWEHAWGYSYGGNSIGDACDGDTMNEAHFVCAMWENDVP